MLLQIRNAIRKRHQIIMYTRLLFTVQRLSENIFDSFAKYAEKMVS